MVCPKTGEPICRCRVGSGSVALTASSVAPTQFKATGLPEPIARDGWLAQREYEKKLRAAKKNGEFVARTWA